jgi:predicted negative regulator of RcsB-dependent stress response
VAHMTKGELREDPVLEQIQRGVAFAEQNARWLIAGAVIVVAAVVGFMALHRGSLRSESEAGQLLVEAQASYLQGNASAAESQLKEMLQSHGRSRAAAGAQLTLGDVLLAQSRPEEALKAYQEAFAHGAKDPLVAPAAERGQGAALEDLTRYAEASQTYEKAAGMSALGSIGDLISAARTALLAGDAPRAKTLLERAKQADATSDYLGDINALTARVDAASPQ